MPNFDPVKESEKMVTTLWMTIKHISVEFHTPQILIEIGNAVGKAEALDTQNANQSYEVRIYTEVDLSTLLPQKIAVYGRHFQVWFKISHIFSHSNVPLMNLSNTPVCRNYDRRLSDVRTGHFNLNSNPWGANNSTITKNKLLSNDKNQAVEDNKNLLPLTTTAFNAITANSLDNILPGEIGCSLPNRACLDSPDHAINALTQGNSRSTKVARIFHDLSKNLKTHPYLEI